ncbi:MAG: hypothetical protein K1X88_32655 [Nannocystaceae bacterium]|nr:hypothetical protein [Nannocystaceae bacterium]
MKRCSPRLWLFACLLAGACKDDASGDDGGDDGSTAADDGSSSAGDEGSSGAGSESGSSDSGDGGSSGGAIVCDEVPVITYDTFGAGFLSTYCNGCHGALVADRKGAPAEAVFDSREQAAAYAEKILARRDPPEGVMPMPPAGGVTDDDAVRLEIWLQCFP